MTKRGITVVELLLVTALLAFTTVAGVSAFRSLSLQIESSRAVGVVVTALHTARQEALTESTPVRVVIQAARVSLYKREEGQWRKWREWVAGSRTRWQANAQPVFSITGCAAPLCTVEVTVADRYRHRVTLAITGRVKSASLDL